MGIKELREAYLDTDYRTTEPPFLHIRPLVKNRGLDDFLRTHGHTAWAFITAFNPQSRLQDLSENRSRNQKLEEGLLRLGLDFRKGMGEGRNGGWPPEESYLIFGLTQPQAMDLGRNHDQKSILFGRLGQKAQLIFIP